MDALTELVCGGPCPTKLSHLEMIGGGEAMPVWVRGRTPKDGSSPSHPRVALEHLPDGACRMACPHCGHVHTLYRKQLAEIYAAAVDLGKGRRRAFARRVSPQTATGGQGSFGRPAFRSGAVPTR